MTRVRRWSFPLLWGAAALVGACATSSLPIPAGWTERASNDIRSVRFSAGGLPVTSSLERPRPLVDGAASVMTVEGGVAVAFNGQPITPPFAAIDSLDLSESRGEIVFSARRADGLDLGLVATSGGEVKWLPSDPADEVAVQWAPRGHKISYVIRAPGGDVIRTLHIPTAVSFSLDFPWAHIRDVAWDEPAERMAVVLASPDASARVEVVRYDGASRQVAVPPAAAGKLTVEPFAGGVLLLPPDIAYDERLPVVIWQASDVHDWNAARASLVERERVACIVAPAITPAIASAALARPWAKRDSLFTVGAAAEAAGSAVQATAIVPDAGVPPGRYRREGRAVSVSPAVVQSFAAAYIAEQLKRTSPPNGSSR